MINYKVREMENSVSYRPKDSSETFSSGSARLRVISYNKERGAHRTSLGR